MNVTDDIVGDGVFVLPLRESVALMRGLIHDAGVPYRIQQEIARIMIPSEKTERARLWRLLQARIFRWVEPVPSVVYAEPPPVWVSWREVWVAMASCVEQEFPFGKS